MRLFGDSCFSRILKFLQGWAMLIWGFRADLSSLSFIHLASKSLSRGAPLHTIARVTTSTVWCVSDNNTEADEGTGLPHDETLTVSSRYLCFTIDSSCSTVVRHLPKRLIIYYETTVAMSPCRWLIPANCACVPITAVHGSLNNINQLIFVMARCCVLFEVRTEFLNII
jgi:hypothetical protein